MKLTVAEAGRVGEVPPAVAEWIQLAHERTLGMIEMPDGRFAFRCAGFAFRSVGHLLVGKDAA